MLIRLAMPTDLAEVADLDAEAFSPYGTQEDFHTFAARLQAFPEGFVVLERDGQIYAYGCAEKWPGERQPGLDENPLETHDPGGRIFCITGMAVRTAQRGKGYGLAMLDWLIEIAKRDGCEKIVLETTHAQGLYLKRGFQVVSSRKQRGVRLDVMALDLI